MQIDSMSAEAKASVRQVLDEQGLRNVRVASYEGQLEVFLEFVPKTTVSLVLGSELQRASGMPVRIHHLELMSPAEKQVVYQRTEFA